MSVQIKLTIYCDSCGEGYSRTKVGDVSGVAELAAARREALEEGWARRQLATAGEPRDYCPKCAEQLDGHNARQSYANGPVKRRGFATVEFLVVVALTTACLACGASIARTVSAVEPQRLAYLWDAVCERGLCGLGPFEETIPSVRLTDLSRAHRYCGPGCHADKGGDL